MANNEPYNIILFQVNGSEFVGITHRRAVDLLRNAGHIAVLVVERLVGRPVWIRQVNVRISSDVKKLSGINRSVLRRRHVRLVLWREDYLSWLNAWYKSSCQADAEVIGMWKNVIVKLSAAVCVKKYDSTFRWYVKQLLQTVSCN